MSKYQFTRRTLGKQSPCRKDCPDRRAECHAHCPQWAEFEKLKQEEYKQRDINRSVVEVHIDTTEKIKKWQSEHGKGGHR